MSDLEELAQEVNEAYAAWVDFASRDVYPHTQAQKIENNIHLDKLEERYFHLAQEYEYALRHQ